MFQNKTRANLKRISLGMGHASPSEKKLKKILVSMRTLDDTLGMQKQFYIELGPDIYEVMRVTFTLVPAENGPDDEWEEEGDEVEILSVEDKEGDDRTDLYEEAEEFVVRCFDIIMAGKFDKPRRVARR
jgi:hypothetical protein